MPDRPDLYMWESLEVSYNQESKLVTYTLTATTTIRAPHGLKTKCNTATLKVVEIRGGLL